MIWDPLLCNQCSSTTARYLADNFTSFLLPFRILCLPDTEPLCCVYAKRITSCLVFIRKSRLCTQRVCKGTKEQVTWFPFAPAEILLKLNINMSAMFFFFQTKQSQNNGKYFTLIYFLGENDNAKRLRWKIRGVGWCGFSRLDMP